VQWVLTQISRDIGPARVAFDVEKTIQRVRDSGRALNSGVHTQMELAYEARTGANPLVHELAHAIPQRNYSKNADPQILRENKETKPPTKREVHEAWIEKWKWWKKLKRRRRQKLEAQYPNDPDKVEEEIDKFRIDCGAKARQVLLSLGGRRFNTTVVKGSWDPTYCRPEEGKQARSRYRAGKWDKIANDELHVFSGKGAAADPTTFPLKPGMRIYTAEKAKSFTEEEIERIVAKKKRKKAKTRRKLRKLWRWENRHMVMYYGDGNNILDSIGLAYPNPRPFPHNFYSEKAELFVVLRVYDPFKDLRSE
jgi:hypothetical protein